MGDHAFYSLAGPLDSMPSDRQMRTANFSSFSELTRHLGADPRRILEHHGIDPRAMRDPDFYIDCKSLVDVFEYCSSSLNDSLFGLHLAQLQEPDVYGCVAALCRAAPTLREAIESFIDYIPVAHSPATTLELVEGKDTAELRWYVRNDLGQNRQAHYQATLLNMKLMRQIGGRHFRPSYVNLTIDARQTDIAEFESRLGCPLHVKASANAIALPVDALDQPVASANKLLYRLLGGYLDRVKAASRKTIVERVEDYVRGSLPSGLCSIEQCAKKMGTSVRTLQANLGESGLKFSDILEQQRVDLGKIHLEQGELSLDEVAARLGYSEQSSFGRAFKRWTGMTPQQYRKESRQAAAPDPSLQ
jgi:AraC-like DNA-binding protein